MDTGGHLVPTASDASVDPDVVRPGAADHPGQCPEAGRDCRPSASEVAQESKGAHLPRLVAPLMVEFLALDELRVTPPVVVQGLRLDSRRQEPQVEFPESLAGESESWGVQPGQQDELESLQVERSRATQSAQVSLP